MIPNITKNFYKKVQKAKKCNKCEFCLTKHITPEETYKHCLWGIRKLFTFNDTVKKCKYYKKRSK